MFVSLLKLLESIIFYSMNDFFTDALRKLEVGFPYLLEAHVDIHIVLAVAGYMLSELKTIKVMKLKEANEGQ